VGGYAYVAAWFGGLQIINVNNPDQASLASTGNGALQIWGVDVSGGQAFSSDRDALSGWFSSLREERKAAIGFSTLEK